MEIRVSTDNRHFYDSRICVFIRTLRPMLIFSVCNADVVPGVVLLKYNSLNLSKLGKRRITGIVFFRGSKFSLLYLEHL